MTKGINKAQYLLYFIPHRSIDYQSKTSQVPVFILLTKQLPKLFTKLLISEDCDAKKHVWTRQLKMRCGPN